jgi:hypothetical protein
MTDKATTSAKAGASGIELMLRSMGMGEAMDAAKQLATNGTIQKIIAFVDGIGEMNERLERIERYVAAGSYPGRGGPNYPGPTVIEGSFEAGTGDRQPVSLGSTGEPVDDGHSGNIRATTGV